MDHTRVIKVGDSWGKLTCIGFGVEVTRETSNGITEEIRTRIMDVECSCGTVVFVHADDFPGRRKMKDCGCGAGKSDTKILISLYLPLRLVQKLDVLSALGKESRSSLVTKYLQEHTQCGT